jgi:hypothetical protein
MLDIEKRRIAAISSWEIIIHPGLWKRLRKRPNRPQKWQISHPNSERIRRMRLEIGSASPESGGEAIVAESSEALEARSVTLIAEGSSDEAALRRR